MSVVSACSMEGVGSWILLLLVALIAVYIGHFWWSRRSLPPGPVGWPLFGYMPYIKSNLHGSFMKLGEKYGDVFTVPVGGRDLVVLNSVDLIKEAFLTLGATYSGRIIPTVHTKLGFHDDIFVATFSEKFLKAKRFCTQALKTNGYLSAVGFQRIRAEVDELIGYLEKQSPNEATDVSSILMNCTCNIICSILFNKRFSWNSSEIENILKVTVDFFDFYDSTIYLADVMHPLVREMVYGKHIRKMGDKGKIFTEMIRNMIEEERKTFDPNNLRHYVDTYLKRQEEDPELTDEVLIADTRVVTPDSLVSVSLQISWMFLFVTLWPEIQNKIHKEIEEVIGSSRLPDMSDQTSMPYTHAFMKETMRFAPAITVSSIHATIQDSTLNGYQIPKDTAVIANFWAVHYDPHLFPEPEKFKPERFLDDEGKVIKRDNIMQFSIGHRNCLGEHLTKAEMFLFLTGILQRFRLVLHEGDKKFDVSPKVEEAIRSPPPYKLYAITK